MQTPSSMDDLMEMWEKKLNSVGAGTPALDAFLGLSVYDMRNAALNIDCPFCKRHMLLEAEEIFLTNALIGIWPVARLVNHSFRVGAASLELAAGLEKLRAQ